MARPTPNPPVRGSSDAVDDAAGAVSSTWVAGNQEAATAPPSGSRTIVRLAASVASSSAVVSTPTR